MLLSNNHIAALLSLCYTTLYYQVREFETTFCQGFPAQADETQQVCLVFKGQERRRSSPLP